MMTETERAEAAVKMRSLVAAGRYTEARSALRSYCHLLEQALIGLPLGDPRIGELEQEWLNLLDQTRRRVLTGRAHAAARLARLPRLPRSYGDQAPDGRTWQYLA